MTNKIAVVFLVMAFMLAGAKACALADDKPDKVSYYQYNPNPVQQGLTIWNPVITEHHKDNRVYKSYFQFNPNPVQPAGSLWNNLITEDAGKIKK
jgi:sucrose-6-phosphate hydrolase SacC (GH32 family)